MKNLITVSTFNTRTEAEIAKGFLQSHGISSLVSADDLGGTYQFPFQPTVVGVKVQVNESDLTSAQELLSQKK